MELEKKSETDDHDITDPKWCFCVVSVGDCKFAVWIQIPSFFRAFHYSAKYKTVTDVTAGNRCNLADATDPGTCKLKNLCLIHLQGGRVGPYLSNGSPDLRNLDLYVQVTWNLSKLTASQGCSDGDFIFLVSDGVHGMTNLLFFSCASR